VQALISLLYALIAFMSESDSMFCLLKKFLIFPKFVPNPVLLFDLSIVLNIVLCYNKINIVGCNLFYQGENRYYGIIYFKEKHASMSSMWSIW